MGGLVTRGRAWQLAALRPRAHELTPPVGLRPQSLEARCALRGGLGRGQVPFVHA
eukprot:CAMPEP_0175465296 /NCGR_PEP_ID=MMETSP0095-20121207/70221_1 /TAXON_ID=311494 /ORGANISM="Alexandrium monilatum, Strain CCMP3105" /LENGTH=54 /DNA_ID=CAMNT_0016766613 /DNA_START=13 /DNA_END=173 /DNA_ORIENTATION=+